MPTFTEHVPQFLDGRIALIFQQTKDEGCNGLDPAGTAISSQRAWPRIAVLALQRTPTADAGGTDAEPSCRLSMCRPVGNG